MNKFLMHLSAALIAIGAVAGGVVLLIAGVRRRV